MTYDELLCGLRALDASDFDLNNVEARGAGKLDELTNALMEMPSPERAIPELFAVMERLPESDLGSPGPLVHTLERLKGYENELVDSVHRRPTTLSVWMINRVLNTDLSDDRRESYMLLLREAEAHQQATLSVREDARDFIELQTRKAQSGS